MHQTSNHHTNINISSVTVLYTLSFVQTFCRYDIPCTHRNIQKPSTITVRELGCCRATGRGQLSLQPMFLRLQSSHPRCVTSIYRYMISYDSYIWYLYVIHQTITPAKVWALFRLSHAVLKCWNPCVFERLIIYLDIHSTMPQSVSRITTPIQIKEPSVRLPMRYSDGLVLVKQCRNS